MTIELTDFKGTITFMGRPLAVLFQSQGGVMQLGSPEEKLSAKEAVEITKLLAAMATARDVEAAPERKPEPATKTQPAPEKKVSPATASRAQAHAEAIKADIAKREGAKAAEPEKRPGTAPVESKPTFVLEARPGTAAPSDWGADAVLSVREEKKEVGWDLAGDGKGDDLEVRGKANGLNLDVELSELPEELRSAGQFRGVVKFLRDHGWSTPELLLAGSKLLHKHGHEAVVFAAKGDPDLLKDRIGVVLARLEP